MNQSILVINSGSSSIKFQVFKISEPMEVVAKGQIEGIGVQTTFLAKAANGQILEKKSWDQEKHPYSYFLKYLIDWIGSSFKNLQLVGAGHRVVHGGSEFFKPLTLNDQNIEQLKTLFPLAPLHQPHNLAGVLAIKEHFPNLPQIACFDTAFHTTNPKVFQEFFLPKELRDKGVKRYGFHGLSYEFVSKELKKINPEISKKNIIIAHLGSGASMCALRNGQSVTTSMGMTAIDGLPMGTRPGQLDVGVVLYLLQTLKMNDKEIENLLYKKSGLLGLSEISNDMRQLEENKSEQAQFAIDAFCWRIAQMTGQLAAALEGIDGFVFTGGIGENSKHIRKVVCEKLKWLGIDLDQDLNDKNATRITRENSKISVFVVPTNEELMIAEHTVRTLNLK